MNRPLSKVAGLRMRIERAGGHLDKAWREQSLFADLLAQCAFLIHPEELPTRSEPRLE